MITNNSELVCCPKRIDFLPKSWKVFLAGPIQGAPEWQFDMPNINNVTWLSPRRKNFENFNYEEQTTWEKDHMNYCDVILFWIPEETEHVEGRSYAQTTRTEFGEYLALGKKIIIGCYDNFSGKRYFQTKLNEYGTGAKIHNTLEDCLKELTNYIENCEKNPQTWFTADTHFSDDRALKLSLRPFYSVEEMDKVLIRNWNNCVHPCDTIYHLGDFAKNPEEINKYLNGTKILVYGNYERDGKYPTPDNCFDTVYKSSYQTNIDDTVYFLCHEPLRGKKKIQSSSLDVYGVIFGHIHGRQKVKKFNGVDVGVDGNNFKPINLKDVNFLLNAIHKAYYDEEVWS